MAAMDGQLVNSCKSDIGTVLLQLGHPARNTSFMIPQQLARRKTSPADETVLFQPGEEHRKQPEKTLFLDSFVTSLPIVSRFRWVPCFRGFSAVSC
jgi:hypothetical protein